MTLNHESQGAGFGETREEFIERTMELLEAGDVCPPLLRTRMESKGVLLDAVSELQPDGSLTLFACDFQGQTSKIGRMSRSEAVACFKQMLAFAEKSIAGSIISKLPINSPQLVTAGMLFKNESDLRRVRLVLVTDRALSDRVKELPGGEILEGVPYECHVWDTRRLGELTSVGREPIEIDLADEQFGGAPLPALPATIGEAGYRSYLCVMSGITLARIYGKYGSRLLEANVRGFLGERVKVNGGVRSTLMNRPEMFFAYNNGLTATASGVELEKVGDGLCIRKLHDLQIVNGGQTTASIFWADQKTRGGVRLDEVFVQMKLTVIPDEMADRFDEIVADISRYANSQNKVKDSDLFSNHPFHREMERVSRAITFVPTGGGITSAGWYYERYAGQYENELRKLSQKTADLNAFKSRYPKVRVIDKAAFARNWMAWEGHPHTASLGREKNMKAFAEIIAKRWEANAVEFNDLFFKDGIAKAIIYNALRASISRQTWQCPFPNATVLYCMGYLSNCLANEGKAVNLLAIWKAQGIDQAAVESLMTLARQIYHAADVSPERKKKPGFGNMDTWMKSKECWSYVAGRKFEMPVLPEDLVITADAKQKQAQYGQTVAELAQIANAKVRVNELHAQGTWSRLSNWYYMDPTVLDTDEAKLLARVITGDPDHLDAQEAYALLKAMHKAKAAGFAD